MAEWSCDCNTEEYPNAKSYKFTLDPQKHLSVAVFFNGSKELGVRIFADDETSINRWMRNRVGNEGPGVYSFEPTAEPRSITICGASKDCYRSQGCPDKNWYCGYQVGSPVIHRDDNEEKRIEVNWDDSREDGDYKNISVILTIY